MGVGPQHPSFLAILSITGLAQTRAVYWLWWQSTFALGWLGVSVGLAEVLLRAGLGFVWGSFRLGKGLTRRMLGGFKLDFGSVLVGLGLICPWCVAGLAVTFGLLQGVVMQVLGWFGIGCGALATLNHHGPSHAEYAALKLSNRECNPAPTHLFRTRLCFAEPELVEQKKPQPQSPSRVPRPRPERDLGMLTSGQVVILPCGHGSEEQLLQAADRGGWREVAGSSLSFTGATRCPPKMVKLT